MKKKQEGHIKDLSCAGACISTQMNVSANQNIDLTIYLDDETPVSLKGKIAWIKPSLNKTHVGIIFYNTPQDVQDLILEYAFELDRDKLKKHWFKNWDGKENF